MLVYPFSAAAWRAVVAKRGRGGLTSIVGELRRSFTSGRCPRWDAQIRGDSLSTGANARVWRSGVRRVDRKLLVRIKWLRGLGGR